MVRVHRPRFEPAEFPQGTEVRVDNGHLFVLAQSTLAVFAPGSWLMAELGEEVTGRDPAQDGYWSGPPVNLGAAAPDDAADGGGGLVRLP